MRIAITNLSVLSLLLVFSSLTAGCAASTPAMQTSSPAATVADTSRDPSWTPPGEMDVFLAEPSRSSDAAPVNAESMPRPNRRAIPRGQLHAATY